MKKRKINKIQKLINLSNNIAVVHASFDYSMKITGVEITDKKIKQLNTLHDSYAAVIEQINQIVLLNTLN